MTNTAVLLFPIITGHVASHGDGTMTVFQIILLALIAVFMFSAVWFALTDKGNAALAAIVKRFRKVR